MVLRLSCPHCGLRPVEEWVFAATPDTPDHVTDPEDRDVDRGYMTANMEGVEHERWFHTDGCRRWYTIGRNTTLDY